MPDKLYDYTDFIKLRLVINLYCSRQRTMMYSAEVQNGLYDTKRGRRKMGCHSSEDKLSMCCWPYSWSYQKDLVFIFHKNQKKASGQNSIALSDLRKMPILLPPLEAQKLYSDKSVPFYHRIEIVRRENQELQKMYHLLIDILIFD